MIMWTKKHWKKIIAVVGIISLVFLIIPIAVNIIIGSDFNPTPIELNGSTSDWHNFLAVYLGALIGATVPFIILYKTLQNNSKENKQNRKTQVLLIKHQSESVDLQNFKKSATALCDSFCYNKLVKICNLFILDDVMPLDLIKKGFQEMIIAKRNFLMDAIPAPAMVALIDEEARLYDYYGEILLDLEVVVSYHRLSVSTIKSDITDDPHASAILKEIILKNITALNDNNAKSWLNKILQMRLDVVNPNMTEKIWDLISQVYISKKNEIIDYLSNAK